MLAIVLSAAAAAVALMAADAIAIKIGWRGRSAFPFVTGNLFEWFSSTAWAGIGALATAIVAITLFVIGQRSQAETTEIIERSNGLIGEIAALAAQTREIQDQLASLAKANRLDELVRQLSISTDSGRIDVIVRQAIGWADGSHDRVRVISAFYSNRATALPASSDEFPIADVGLDELRDILDEVVALLPAKYAQGLLADDVYGIRKFTTFCLERELPMQAIAGFIVGRVQAGDQLNPRALCALMRRAGDESSANWPLVVDVLRAVSRGGAEKKLTELVYGMRSGHRSGPAIDRRARTMLAFGAAMACDDSEMKPPDGLIPTIGILWSKMLSNSSDELQLSDVRNLDMGDELSDEWFVTAVAGTVAKIVRPEENWTERLLDGLGRLIEQLSTNEAFTPLGSAGSVVDDDVEVSEFGPPPDPEPEPGDYIQASIQEIRKSVGARESIDGLVLAVKRVFPGIEL